MATLKRSPGHPTSSLAGSIERARRLYQASHDHWMPLEAIASTWGLSAKSSGFLQYLATLKQYGLLDEQGGGESRELKLSDIALDILTYPENSREWSIAVSTAATSPPLYEELIAKFAGRIPPEDAAIRVYLLRQRPSGTFHPEQVDAFIRQFRDTLEFAGLTDSGLHGQLRTMDPSIPEVPQAPEIGSFIQWTSNDVDQFEVPQKVVGVDGDWVFVEGSQTGLPMSEVSVVDPPATPKGNATPPPNPFYSQPKPDEPKDGMALERMTLDEGPVKLEWPSEISAESMQEFEYWVSGLMQRARRKTGGQHLTKKIGATGAVHLVSLPGTEKWRIRSFDRSWITPDMSQLITATAHAAKNGWENLEFETPEEAVDFIKQSVPEDTKLER